MQKARSQQGSVPIVPDVMRGLVGARDLDLNPITAFVCGDIARLLHRRGLDLGNHWLVCKPKKRTLVNKDFA